MNFKVMLAVALGLALTSGGAFAKDKEKKKDKKKDKTASVEKRFNEIDTNHDGQISKDEFKAYSETKHGKKDGEKKDAEKKDTEKADA